MQLGIFGFAHGHGGIYVDVWRNQPGLGVEPAAAWDHDEARLAENAAKFNLRPFTSPDALLAVPEIKAVLIAAETSRHAGLAVAALRAGKPVILQKPIALTLDEADAIAAAARETGAPFTMAWQMRVDPENLRIRELIAAGTFGRIQMVRRRHCLATHRMKNFDKSWHVDPAQNRNIWADDAAHPTDFLYWLFGMPVAATAEFTSFVNPRIPHDNGVAVFRYATGMLAEVTCSFAVSTGENTTEIIGERGVLIQNFGDGPSAGARRPGLGVSLKWRVEGDAEWIVEDSARNQGDRIRGLAAPLADFLHGCRPPIATAAEGRDVLAMVLACEESAATGKRISLPPSTA